MANFKRHSRHVTHGPRWKALRMLALDRDGWACVQCGERRRLEVDHILAVRTHPELSYILSNLQCLCGRCHALKTRLEMGLKPISKARQQWRNFLNQPMKPIKQDTKC